MSGKLFLGKDEPVARQSADEYAKQEQEYYSDSYTISVTVPRSYCLHRSMRAIVPNRMTGEPQVIETAMKCRTDCQHYEPKELAGPHYPKGRCRYGEGFQGKELPVLAAPGDAQV